MDARREALTEAVARGDLPFVVATTADADGTVWASAAGEARPGTPADADTGFRIFSMTKAVAAVAAMILVERGRLDLDAPVARLLPEFERIAVLDGWDGDRPRLRAPRTAVTVRNLATHTAGFAYTHWNAEMRRYRAASGLPAMASGVRAALFYPLIAEPGAGWSYGIGPDWLGLVVEAASGQSIDVFCRDEIFGPLGMTATDFKPVAPLAEAWSRTPEGGFAPLEIAPPAAPEFWGMGDALYSTPADYLRFLRLFLNGGAPLLSAAATRGMLANQIGGLRVAPMISTSARISADVEIVPGAPKSHSLIGQRTEADAPGMRRAGASGWAGILNTHWWVDPAAGRAAVFMTQLFPFADPRAMAAYATFERAVYA